MMRLVCAVLTFLALPVFAQADGPDRAPATPVIDASEVASLGISLVVVIAAILVVGWMYSRMRVGGKTGGDAINVVASRALGPKERLMVIQVADQQLLVGMTASQLQTLHIFDAPVVAAAANEAESGFAGRLRSAISEFAK